MNQQATSTPEGNPVFALKVVRPDGIEENLSDLAGVPLDKARELMKQEVGYIEHEGRSSLQGGYVLYIQDMRTRLQQDHVRCCFDPCASMLRTADILYMEVTPEGVFMLGEQEDGEYFKTLQRVRPRTLAEHHKPDFGMIDPLEEIQFIDVVRIVARRNKCGMMRALDILQVSHRGRHTRKNFMEGMNHGLSHEEAVEVVREIFEEMDK